LPEFYIRPTIDDATLFKSIRKLLPGHLPSYDGTDVNIRRYWDWWFGTLNLSGRLLPHGTLY
jgi:asparagine synthetase B (glutamine-hydrolysing)